MIDYFRIETLGTVLNFWLVIATPIVAVTSLVVALSA